MDMPGASQCSYPFVGGTVGMAITTVTSTAVIVATTVLAAIPLVYFIRALLNPLRPSVLLSPLKTLLPRMPAEERAAMPYGPDHFPGSRDVQTPV